MVRFGFLPQILDPTRVTESPVTIINNIYTNCHEYNHYSGNILISISDHFSQFLSVERQKVDFKNVTMYRGHYYIQKWNNNLSNVNDQFNDFYWRLEGCVDRHAPLKKVKMKELKLNSKPWITPEIARMIKHRDNLFKRKKRQPNNDNIRSLYNIFRNRVNRELKKSKKSYYNSYFENCKHDIQKTWDGIKSIINPNRSSKNITQLNINGKIIDNPLDISNKFNNFFVNVGPSTERDIPITPTDRISPEKFLKNRNQLNFIISHISTEEVLDIIKTLNNKSTGPSSIPTKLLVLIQDLIIFPLCKFINTSFTTGKFPDA